jgi:hypothetical protein
MKQATCAWIAALSLLVGVAIGLGVGRIEVAESQADQSKVQKRPEQVRFVVDPRAIDFQMSHGDMTFTGSATGFIMEIRRPLDTVNPAIDRLHKENKMRPFAGRPVTDFASELATVTTIQAHPSQFIVEWVGSDRNGNDAAASAVVDVPKGTIRRIDFMGVDWED